MPRALLILAPMAIFARAGLPVANADELVAYAAKVAKEGKPLTYASAMRCTWRKSSDLYLIDGTASGARISSLGEPW